MSDPERDESLQWEIVDDDDTERDPDDADRDAADELERKHNAQKYQADQERLNARHIKSVLLEKRALYRQRTFALIFGAACVVCSGQLAWLGFGHFRAEAWPRVAAYGVIAVGLLVYSIRFFRRARRYRIEAEKTVIPEPETAPDFTPLSDGSQFADNLNHLSR